MPKKIPFEERPEYVLPGEHIHPVVARAIISAVKANSLSPEGKLPDASVRAIRNIAKNEDWVNSAHVASHPDLPYDPLATHKLVIKAEKKKLNSVTFRLK